MSCDHELANEWVRCSGRNASYITNAFMDQNLVGIVFLQILTWALSKTSLKVYRERKSAPYSGCCKTKKVNMFMIFIPL